MHGWQCQIYKHRSVEIPKPGIDEELNIRVNDPAKLFCFLMNTNRFTGLMGLAHHKTFLICYLIVLHASFHLLVINGQFSDKDPL